MKNKITKEWFIRLLVMLIAVLLMGFSLSLLVLTHFGADPCSSMNYGVSRMLGISFGNYQIIFNLVLLAFMFLFYRSVIGFGTFGNMILIGYTADFFTFIWHDICHIPNELDLAVRIIILIPSLMLFVVAAACYMQSGHGVSPYDAFSFIINEQIQKKTKGKSHFKIIRYIQDLVCSLIGLLTGGECGIITFLMVITLAPIVEYVGKLFERIFPSSQKDSAC